MGLALIFQLNRLVWLLVGGFGALIKTHTDNPTDGILGKQTGGKQTAHLCSRVKWSKHSWIISCTHAHCISGDGAVQLAVEGPQCFS